jgi:transcriptional regulator with XRE-family HTH domain
MIQSTETKRNGRNEAIECTLVFVRNVRERMEQHKVNNSQLARQLGIARPGLSRLLAGKAGNPSLVTVAKIAEVLGVPVWELLREPPKSRKAARTTAS